MIAVHQVHANQVLLLKNRPGKKLLTPGSCPLAFLLALPVLWPIFSQHADGGLRLSDSWCPQTYHCQGGGSLCTGCKI